MRRLFLTIATAVLMLTAAVPSFSADSGTVNATVTAATPCITLSIPPLDFGTLPLNTSFGVSKVLLNPGSYTNCSVQSEKILQRGTDASGAGGAAWTLDHPSTCTINQFGSELGVGATVYQVLKTDQQIETAPAGATTPIGIISLTMPCTGSSGAGTTMSWQYIFTATF